MLLTNQAFEEQVNIIESMSTGVVAIDFETNGLNIYGGDRAFILGFAYNDYRGSWLCLDPQNEHLLQRLISNPNIKYLAHNATFEMSICRVQFNQDIAGPIWDTEVMERVRYNDHKKYGLQACAERAQLSKHPPMLEWLKKNDHQYHKAPLDLIVPYVEQDAWLSLYLYQQQVKTFKEWDNSATKPHAIVSLELKTTRHIHDMQCMGLLVNIPYCQEAINYEKARVVKAKKDFEEYNNVPFVDSRKTFEPVFKQLGITFAVTVKGNASFSEESLKASKNHPTVAAILDYRNANKRVSTYWENFIRLANISDNVIHPSIRQAGTATGRFSSANPNVQNWPDDDDEHPYPVRRAFIARPGCIIISIDYSQMEYRLIADEAGDMGVIEAIQIGADFHQKVADMADVKRQTGKIARFARLYGCGIDKLALILGCNRTTAERIARAIDADAPQIARYCRQLIGYANTAPFGYNWLGRRYYFDKGFGYKYPDYRTQGGCSDILRIAIDDVANFLKSNAHPMTQILIPIHDELVFNWDERDLHLIEPVKELMRKAHRNKRFLDMDVAAYKGLNFHDIEAIRV